MTNYHTNKAGKRVECFAKKKCRLKDDEAPTQQTKSLPAGITTAQQIFEEQDRQRETTQDTIPGAVHPWGRCTDYYGNGWCDGVEITTYDPYVREMTDQEVEITACRGVLKGLQMDS